MQYFLKSFFVDLNSHSINYYVWGNYEGLPNSLNGSDLDIVINSKDKADFYRIFKASLKKYNGKIISYFDTNHTEHFRIIGEYNGNWWGLMVDVFLDEFYYQGKVYIPSKWIAHFQTTHNNISVNEIKFSYLAGFLKELLHNGRIKEKYYLNTILELQKNFDTYNKFLVSVYGSNFSESLKYQILNGCLDLIDLRKKALSGLGIHKVNFALNNFLKLKRFRQPSPGFSVVFLGTDGAGKSTIINKITPVLNDGFHNAVYYEHMRPNKFPSIAKIFGNGDSKNTVVDNPHEKSPSGFLGSLLRWSYYMIDYTIGFGLKVFPKKSLRSCFWIFDRYYYDYLLDPKRTRVILPKVILKFGSFLMPKPDLIICLGASPEIIHDRKPELPLAEVKRQVNKLYSFSKNQNRAVWIDTSTSIDISSNKAIREICEMMNERFNKINSMWNL